MSTADKAEKQAGHGAAWANLVICGGLSWGVNLWHALHPKTAGHGGVTLGTAILALLCATGPVVSAAFASHNISSSDAGNFKKFLTYVVFAMGMALSITAQAEAVEGVFGNIGFGVTFALMLDLSAFMSLHSIMSGASAEASEPVSDGRLEGVRPDASVASVQTSVGASDGRAPERLTDASQTPSGASAQTPAKASAKTSPKPRSASKKKGGRKPSLREQIRPILIENPEMNAADVAREIGREPSGHIRTTCGSVLAELIESGEIQAPPLRIAQ